MSAAELIETSNIKDLPLLRQQGFSSDMEELELSSPPLARHDTY